MTRRHILRMTYAAGIAVLAAIFSAGGAHASPIIFTYSGSIVTYTVKTTGVYEIAAYGAQGGNTYTGGQINSVGGDAATASGEFSLTAGSTLEILVGGNGGSSSNGGGAGGGGGSFVALDGTLLAAAGGGGGAGTLYSANSAQGSTSGGGANSVGGAGGSNGGGGGGGTLGGGGGAGYSGNGSGPCAVGAGCGGTSFLSGGSGGAGGSSLFSSGGNGGFGGGGGAGAGGAGGGGGGYSGGGGGDLGSGGGGGGSYLDASLLYSTTAGVTLGGARSAPAEVTLTDLSPATTPEPASLLLFGTGLLGLAYFIRRREKRGADEL